MTCCLRPRASLTSLTCAPSPTVCGAPVDELTSLSYQIELHYSCLMSDGCLDLEKKLNEHKKSSMQRIKQLEMMLDCKLGALTAAADAEAATVMNEAQIKIVDLQHQIEYLRNKCSSDWNAINREANKLKNECERKAKRVLVTMKACAEEESLRLLSAMNKEKNKLPVSNDTSRRGRIDIQQHALSERSTNTGDQVQRLSKNVSSGKDDVDDSRKRKKSWVYIDNEMKRGGEEEEGEISGMKKAKVGSSLQTTSYDDRHVTDGLMPNNDMKSQQEDTKSYSATITKVKCPKHYRPGVLTRRVHKTVITL